MRGRSIVVLAALVVVLLPAPTTASAAEAPLGQLTFIGDLDGDGHSDVLSSHNTEDDPNTVDDESVTTVTALEGSDGTELWTIDIPYAGYRVERLSDGGILFTGFLYSRGTFVTGLSGYESPANCCWNGAAIVTVRMVALNADGTERWQRTFNGSHLYVERNAYVDHLAIFGGVLAGANGSDMSLVSLYEREPTAEGQDDRMTTMVLDNRTGAEVSSNTLDVDGLRTIVRPVDDLTADGAEDYLVETEPVEGVYVTGNGPIGGAQVPPQNNAPRELHAIDSSSGEELWSLSLDEDMSEGVTAIGDIVGDATPDLALNDQSLDIPAGPRTISIIDGSTGQVAAEIPGQVALPAPDADGNSRDEILAVDYDILGDTRWVSYGLFAADGTALRSETYSITAPAASTQVRPFFDAGDVNGDGTNDLSHELWADTSAAEDPRDERVIDGTGGNTIRVGTTGTPLRASVDGEGDDIYTIAGETDSTERDLAVLDGLTGAELWTFHLDPPGEDSINVQVQAGDVDGDGLADVLVQAESTTDGPGFIAGGLNGERFVEYFVLSGADGHVIWQA